jgi:PAS domain S-box-containing protein
MVRTTSVWLRKITVDLAFPRVSLGVLIAGGALITALVPAAVLWLTSALALQAFDRSETVARSVAVTRALAADIDDDLIAQRREISDLADTLGLTTALAPAMKQLLARSMTHFEYIAELAVADPGGHIITGVGAVSARRQTAGAQLNPATVRLLRGVLETGQPAIAPAFRVSRTTGAPYLEIGAPVVTTKGVRLVLIAWISTASTQTLVDRSAARAATGRIVVTSASGRRVAGHGLTANENPDYSRTPVWPIVHRAEAGSMGIFTGPLGNVRLGGYATVPTTGWKVWKTVRIEELGVRERVPFRASLVWLAIAGAFVLAIVLARMLVLPMDSLRETADAIAAGDLSRRARPGQIGELSKLARAINSMAESLQKNIEMVHRANEQLESAVDDRTSELRRANERMGAILDASPVAITAIDGDGKVTGWNRAAEAMFGYSAAEVIGNAPLHLEETAFAAFRRLFEETVASKEQLPSVAWKKKHRDGRQIDIRISRMSYPEGRGRRGVVFAIEDETDRKVAEAQLRHAEKIDAIGHLTGGIAHDFNNLLSVVIGNLDLLQLHVGDDSKACELIQDALSASVNGAEMNRQLLAFSRQQTLTPRVVDLNSLIFNTVKLLVHTLGETISVKFVDAAGLWPIFVDANQLESAIINMAINARDAMPNGGVLTISTANAYVDAEYAATRIGLLPGDYAKIEISDTGTGMPPEVADRIFEPFFTTKGATTGTGLGLARVHGFVKQSGGHIALYTEPGSGTSFTIYLPRALEGALPERRVRREVAVEFARAGERILAVDDNEAVRVTVGEQLSTLGYEVRLARNGAEAIGLLERGERFDLVFSDVIMPGMTGVALAKQIERRWPKTKVLLASGFPAHALDQDGAGLNISILDKPYRFADLARKVRQALDL